MRLPVAFSTIMRLAAASVLLSGCGKDFNGFGELDGWGGYTKQYGNVDESFKPVGLCSYTGGCMPESSDDEAATANSYKGTKASSGAGSPDDGSQ